MQSSGCEHGDSQDVGQAALFATRDEISVRKHSDQPGCGRGVKVSRDRLIV